MDDHAIGSEVMLTISKLLALTKKRSYGAFLTQVHNTNIEKNMVHGSMNRVAC
jgi:hypothetical protein